MSDPRPRWNGRGDLGKRRRVGKARATDSAREGATDDAAAAPEITAHIVQRRRHRVDGRHAGALLGRVNPPRVQNFCGRWRVVPDMGPVNEVHVAEPGLAVIEIAAADDKTAFALQEALAARWATATANRTTRESGVPGVRLRCYPDLRRSSARR